MTNPIRLALSATLVALLAACQAASPQLPGRTFLSVGIAENGAPRALVAGTRIRLEFKDGGISVNGGCNSMAGDYQLSGGRLILGATATTDMACDPARMAQDDWLLAVLGARPALTLAGNDLTIDAGSVVLQLTDRRVVEPDLQLIGPTWTVDSIFSADAVSSIPEGAVATLVFRADGTLDVNTACNQGSARWKAVGTGIEVSGLGLTKKGCAGAAGELESAVVSTLNAGTLAAAIEANELLLRAGAVGLGLRGR